jgi:ribonuclease R
MSPRTPGRLERQAVLDLIVASTTPLHTREIAERLAVPESKFTALQRVLDDLVFEALIVPMSGQRFRVGKAQREASRVTLSGVLTVNPRGFGFVKQPGAEDIYVPEAAMRGALHGDLVEVRVVARGGRGIEGAVEKIVERRMKRVGGTLVKRGKSAWVEPDDSRVRGPIVLPRGDFEKGTDGDAVVVTITRYPVTDDENPEGTLTAVLGTPGDPNVEVAKVLAREGVEAAHPPDAVAEAQAYGAEVDPAALVGREDLTHLPLPTIDPEDARDHDDAVWAVRNDDGSYTAWIAIADVSHYVKPGTALDADALARSTSIYLPDRAIPMLPRELSSNLCSLLPDVIRLCLCAEVHLDAAGIVTKTRLLEGFIKSRAKLTYQGVARALGLTELPEPDPKAEAMRDDLRVLWDLSRLLRGRRMARGALDFDLPEAKVQLDPARGTPIGVEKRSEDPGVAKAYTLIEEMMLLANETVASYLVERNVPTVFRDHGAPDDKKLERFVTMCDQLDVKFEIEDARDPKRLSAFLKRISTHEQKQVLHMLLLRAMKQAFYGVENIGHFGLASTAYLHFTSPIRRYPDITAHRAVRAVLRHEPIDRSTDGVELLRNAAAVASDLERRAMEIEREVVDLYRALYMRSRIGEMFEGTVTGLVGTGVFVNVDKPFVDVLIRMESLGQDDYQIDDDGLSVTGRRSGDRIGLGDKLMIVVEDVQILRRTVYGRRVVGEDTVTSRRKQTRAIRRTGETRTAITAAKEGKPARAERGGDKPPKRGAKPAKPTKPAKAKRAPKPPKQHGKNKSKKKR